MTKDTQPKPSAGALRAAKEILDTDHQIAARIIDRETGVAELLEAAKHADVAAQVLFIAAEQSKRDVSLEAKLALSTAAKEFGDKWADVQQAITKCEGE
jgi:uncharacterized protein YciW